MSELAGGRLVVVGTPIGNLEDVTFRAVRALREADVVAAEDTRTTRKLLARYDIHTPLVSYHRHNLAARTGKLLDEIRAGRTVALVSEAGMPGISDPGEEIVRACLDAVLPVEIAPGVTALTTALVLSGLPTGRFLFLGFLPPVRARRRKALTAAAAEPGSLVLYEAPHRLVDTLEDVLLVLGNRPLAVARELTKLHEEVVRGTVAAALDRFRAEPPRGEVTLVLGGATAPAQPADTEAAHEDALTHARRLIEGGMSVRDAARAAAGDTPGARRKLYQELVKPAQTLSPREMGG